MPKASTSGATLTKIANALNAMREQYSTKEYRRFEGKQYSSQFEISNTFSTILRNLGAIQVNPDKRGEYRLTDKMAGLRPTTVLKHINQYQSERRSENKPSRRRKRAYTRTVRVVQPELFSNPVNNELSFETIVIALKERIRKEVMAELYDSVSK